METQDEIFSGVRVIEIGQYIAAPVAAKLMSDMGAEVFKVELPPVRRYDAGIRRPQGSAGRFVYR